MKTMKNIGDNKQVSLQKFFNNVISFLEYRNRENVGAVHANVSVLIVLSLLDTYRVCTNNVKISFVVLFPVLKSHRIANMVMFIIIWIRKA